MAAVCAVTSVLVLVLAATPCPSSALPAGSRVTFAVESLSCVNTTAQVNLSSVSVSVLYLNTSDSLSNGTNDSNTVSYNWNAGTNYTEDTGLSGAVSILLDANPPSQCPWTGTTWLNWTNVSDGGALEVTIVFSPGNSDLGNGSWGAGNSTVTVSPPAPAFPYFLEMAGLGLFCVFLYWTLKGWRKLTSLASGDAS